MSLRLLYLIFTRLCSWLVLLGRSAASKDAELLDTRDSVVRENICVEVRVKFMHRHGVREASLSIGVGEVSHQLRERCRCLAD